MRYRQFRGEDLYSDLIDILTKDVLNIVQTKIEIVEQNEHVLLNNEKYDTPTSYHFVTNVVSNKHGYLQLLDYNELLRLAVEFALKKIVEITLRAISPAINDPNTAIDCIQHLGLALAEVSKLDGHYFIFHDDQSKPRVVPQKPFEEMLYITFYQICYYGRADISVILAIFDALIMMVENNIIENNL